MKKSVVWVCLVLMFLFCVANVCAEESATIPAAVIWLKPALRENPNTESNVIEVLNHGDELEAEAFTKDEEARINGYRYVYTSAGNQGWILEESLCFWPEWLEIAETGVKVYTSETMKYTCTDGLVESTRLVLLETMDNCYSVSFRGASGYISKLENVYSSKVNTYYQYRLNTNTMRLVEPTHAYSYPDTNSAQIKSYNVGEKVQVYTAVSDAVWTVIDVDGRYAYIPSHCVK